MYAGVILKSPVEGLGDSKTLSEKKRELLFEQIIGCADVHTVITKAAEIDAIGLSQCIKSSLEEIIRILDADEYLFDGNSSFGIPGLKTMVKADSKVNAVSAASIIAKVTRDRMMCDYAKHYPQYGFEKHKGYASKAHIEAIKQHGYCEIHRRSYKLKALREPTLF